MRVVEGHAPDARKPADDAGLLVPVHLPEFGDAHGQVAVAAGLALVHLDVVRAAHRPQHEVFVLAQRHRREHAVLVVLPVARLDVQFLLRRVRGVDVLVAGLPLVVGDEGFEQPADGRALGQQHGEAGAEDGFVGEQFEFAPDLAVVALRRFLQAREVRLEVVAAGPRDGVEPLQRLVLLVAAPVRPGHLGDLDALRVEVASGLDVRPAAQVGEGVLLVDGDGRRARGGVTVLVLTFGESVDEFELVRVVLEDVSPLVGRDFADLERVLALDDGPHPVGDPVQVAVGRVHVEVEVVVEAVLDGRADGGLGLREPFHHRLRENVCEGVP